ncbi:hypothetical protein UFOVP964_2 [uncultured Caudovirales phage]|uniref:Uncharacterized protein n=1 Tax=uncultured Caudovirales phage TaxID=2100421 RepID=A0A6J5P5X0_9CAUD|nr:hypothetical protein UFOVP854_2 [uncultured Caudovirales phage]CAB4173632.1 hypothetical protein UFOVP964_2 [uncultured Caudovirales phage]CAB4179574.1 hypothetical protein UFOVP1034_156 [uncultured Caudovirales phage]CAB4189200.1 hypothetical protein UFOVP1177_156 [uncultured Caudovirales phage]CAB4193746.1 hypothetical protein UFOVP1243_143 [uncultured Caudovirales phage]
MATYSKLSLQPVTGTSNLGVPILVVATASTGTTIHTTTTSATTFDEIWLYAYNSSTASVVLTIQYGGTATPLNDIKLTIPATSGLTLVIPGLVLSGTGSASTVMYAYAGTASVVTVSGYINRVA